MGDSRNFDQGQAAGMPEREGARRRSGGGGFWAGRLFDAGRQSRACGLPGSGTNPFSRRLPKLLIFSFIILGGGGKVEVGGRA